MTSTKTGDRTVSVGRAADDASSRAETIGSETIGSETIGSETIGSETRRWTSASTASSRRAYERRIRRRQKMSGDRLLRPGQKSTTSALNRAPFVVALIALLGLGVTAVLWLNTMTDEAGMRTSSAKSRTTDLRLTIEQLRHDVAMLDATPRIAEQAKALGMVQAGDSAVLIVDGSGAGTVVGEPSYVQPAAPPAPAPDPAAAQPAPAAQPGAQPAPADQPAAQAGQPGADAAPAGDAAAQPPAPEPQGAGG